MLLNLVENSFCSAQVSVAAVYRRGKQLYNFPVSSFIRVFYTKNYLNRLFFETLLLKIKRGKVSETHCITVNAPHTINQIR